MYKVYDNVSPSFTKVSEIRNSFRKLCQASEVSYSKTNEMAIIVLS